MEQRDKIGPFITVTFLFTWGLQWPGVLAAQGWLPGQAESYLPFAALGIFGPLVAALTLTYKAQGREGLRALGRKLTLWRVPTYYYVLGLLVPGILLTAALVLLRQAGWTGAWHFVPAIPQLIVGVVISLAEEVGWRGYALPRFEARYGRFGGAGILGVVWAAWHIPMFVGLGIALSPGMILVMLLYFFGGSLFFAWLYHRSGGSLLIATIAHLGAHLNNSHRALPDDMLPLVVHAIIYAGLGLAVMRRSAYLRRSVVGEMLLQG